MYKGYTITIAAREGIKVSKNTTLNVRVDSDVKARAERVLTQLGVPMATEIDNYHNKNSLTGGIPFVIRLPMGAPDEINADKMSTTDIKRLLVEGYEDIKKGKVQDADAAFRRFNDEV